jgi:hypothetical protein
MTRTRCPHNLTMSSISEVRTTAGEGSRSANSATMASTAYLARADPLPSTAPRCGGHSPSSPAPLEFGTVTRSSARVDAGVGNFNDRCGRHGEIGPVTVSLLEQRHHFAISVDPPREALRVEHQRLETHAASSDSPAPCRRARASAISASVNAPNSSRTRPGNGPAPLAEACAARPETLSVCDFMLSSDSAGSVIVTFFVLATKSTIPWCYRGRARRGQALNAIAAVAPTSDVEAELDQVA